MTATMDDVHWSRTFPGAAVDGNALRRILRNKAQAARQPMGSAITVTWYPGLAGTSAQMALEL